MLDANILKNEERAVFALRGLYRQYGYLPYKMSKFEDYEYYIDSFHFPYGPLQALNGVRQDAAGFIRRELSHRMQLRYTPELIFESDTNIEYAAHINELLKQAEGQAHDDEAR